jgi:hypothetical protein
MEIYRAAVILGVNFDPVSAEFALLAHENAADTTTSPTIINTQNECA